MSTRPPSITRVLVAVGFVLSCFGLILFLWVAFGGPIPLAPEGYRFTVPVKEASQLAVESDVRISGVSVGKVKALSLGQGNQAIATIQMDNQYAPIPADTKAILRQKTLLGETYVELTPGSKSSGELPEGGSLPAAQVSNAVQLDEVFRTFDAPTRAAFQAWMEGASQALRGQGQNLSDAIGSLDPFAQEADRALRILDSQQLAVHNLIRDGGDVFQALSERQGQLRGLVTNAATVFGTTARRDRQLAQTFQIFPTFLRQSRLTVARLASFSRHADPLVQQLRPAAAQLSPTLIDLGRLAPDLKRFLTSLNGTIDASRQGLPALQRLIGSDLHPLFARLDPYLSQLNPILQGVALYRHEITALLGNVAAATNNVGSEGGKTVNQIRTEAPLGPEALAAFPKRLQTERTNPYLKPLGYNALSSHLPSFETRQCSSGTHATLNPADAPAFPGDLFDRIRQYAFDGSLDSNALPHPACNQQGDFHSIGMFPEFSQYLHVRRAP